MPATSQNLYFHLGMHADDDGVVEAYPVMCSIGASEDDLRVIISKGFATLLNSDMVTFLNDWLENNNIRADRKVDSIYKELLLEIVPDAMLKESKPSYYSRVKSICQTNDGQVSGKCLANVRIGKYRLDKESKDNKLCASDAAPKASKADIDEFFEKIWKLYPNKKGKGQISASKKKALFEIGYDELSRAIKRYTNDLSKDEWRKPQNGSTFFNSGYVDYLDANYTEPVTECEEEGDRSIYQDSDEYEKLWKELGYK
ncbi:hypothetical protein [Roseburia porci]|uniref:hypothetical protein n=1 Tax=Roseburia porci TaxID=2605790 RepID=UPI001F2215DF|nr:hypothetical protein [Roseburia porci]